MDTNYTIEDKFWIDALTNENDASAIIRMFYGHQLPLSNITKNYPTTVLTDHQIYDIILRVLSNTSTEKIISILVPNFVPFEIEKADICQFSDFDDCYYKVINLVVRSGIEGIDWIKMGFLLRTSPRNQGADMKYGENHGKTAVQLGLCQMDTHHHFWPTGLGLSFDKLSKEEKDLLKPKLCLFIPIIQNYFVSGMDEDLLSTYFGLLKESTQKRRKPNVSKLINIVKESL